VLKRLGREAIRVIDVNVAEKILQERLEGRRSCPKCGAAYHLEFSPPKQSGICDKCASELTLRKDDQPEVIKERFIEYTAKTEPLAAYYKKAGLLSVVDGVGETDQVLDRIVRTLG